ncbi:hypothetical protein DFP72DRAFT_425265 [Ephemerocybe angulata]|uniref:Uncharacterized protein n=1 Tax=Ephemerocybe angulata TaxID=980116 RepID=A0A8H6M6I2_9AGAR|nr:hypothetical protein DFP72DRAFT_425265 [Tulosesus angulatus]
MVLAFCDSSANKAWTADDYLESSSTHCTSCTTRATGIDRAFGHAFHPQETTIAWSSHPIPDPSTVQKRSDTQNSTTTVSSTTSSIHITSTLIPSTSSSNSTLSPTSTSEVATIPPHQTRGTVAVVAGVMAAAIATICFVAVILVARCKGTGRHRGGRRYSESLPTTTEMASSTTTRPSISTEVGESVRQNGGSSSAASSRRPPHRSGRAISGDNIPSPKVSVPIQGSPIPAEDPPPQYSQHDAGRVIAS